jgi:peptidyl-prolyl cis-trans isomerase D
MISFFRRALSSWMVLGLLGLIMIAFIVTGVGGPNSMGGSTQGGGDTVAKVGGKKLGSVDMTRRIQNQVANLKQQNPSLDLTGYVAAGGVERTVDEMIAATAVELFGRKQGIEASRKLVDGEIASLPAFFGATGKFDQATFESLLARERIPERAFRDDLAADLIRRMVLGPAAAGARMPTSLATPYASLLLEVRRGSIGLVPTAAMQGGPAPTPPEIQAYYRENILRYTVPERRVLRYAVIGAEQIAAKAKPSEADIAAAYKADTAKYAASEVRTLSQVILPTEAAAKALVAKVAAGTPFAAAAQQAGFSATDIALGEQSRAQFAGLASAAAADAAFKAAKGTIAGPVKSDFGWHVIHVDAVRAIPARPLAAVRDELAATLETQRSQTALADLVAAIEDGIADGQSFDDVVKAHGLAVATTPALLSSGTAPDEPGYVVSADVKPLLRSGFETTTDEDPTVETIAEGQRYALLALAKIVPAAPRPVPEVRDRVTADLLAQRAQDRAKAVAQAIVAKVNKGMPLAQALASAGMPLPPAQPAGGRRFDIAQQGANVPPPLVLMFGMKANSAKLEAAPNNAGWFVVELDSIEKGDASKTPQLVDNTRRQLSPLVATEYVQQFAKAAETLIGSSRDDRAVGRLKAELSGAAAGQ